MADFDGAQYKDPAGGTESSVGSQIRIDHYLKKALIEARKEQYFGQLADVTSMPKHMGKTLKKYHYIPLLDDANINDQGIDATGAVTANGNLYGSSKDAGSIPDKMPTLTENGGRVNRVGFTRVEIQGTIQKYGFFDEYTQESVDFDTDEDLRMHINREMVNGAMEISEDLLQLDLLDAAGVERFPGDATDVSGVNSDAALEYVDFLRLSIDLDNNRTPKQTKMITGTRMVDTKTISGGRVMYCGTELIPTLEAMTDFHGNPAYIPVHQYAAGGTVLTGEQGAIGNFRIVVVPEMMKWAGAGAVETGDAYETGGNADVFPLLVVGDGSFSTIGFQTDGKTVKFSIKHAAPGSTESYANDPYGETGFMSIKFYYGILIQRAERIAIMYSAATM
jgi:N4-gp56 family major capsid protein